MEALYEKSSAGLPAECTGTRVVVWVSLSRTKRFGSSLVAPGTMLEALEENATNRPSAEMEVLKPLAGLPAESTEARVVVLVSRSRTRMPPLLLVAPGTR